jgi:5'-nucleotidase/UDP-sugar diphosphatase
MKKRGWALFCLLFVAAAVLVGCGSLGAHEPTREPAAPPPVAESGPTQESSLAPETETVSPSAESGPSPAPGAESGATETIVILHTNDFHGAIEPQGEGSGARGGLVNLVSWIDQLRAEDPEGTLVLDAGDTFQGTYASNSTEGEVVMAAMNIAGYDGWTPGNHEFDWGQEVLRARIDQADFPVLAANVLDEASGEIWDAVQPYTIVEVGRARVAILGISYPDTPAINKPQNVAGLAFLGAEETVRRYLPELEAQADLVVVLSHAGYDADLALAKAVDGVDVIVGGHSHTFLESPRKIGGTLIVQAGAKGEVLGRLELTVDLASGEVVDHVGRRALRPVTGDAVAVNGEVKALVDAALADAAGTMNQPIGETAVALKPERGGEFALGNLIADAMLAAEIDGRPADIALHNNGGIRAGLPKGPVNYGQLYAVLPFDNQLMALDLAGAQVLEILEHAVADDPGTLQVAGVHFTFRMDRPVGQRVLEASVGGQALDLEALYRVVTIDYLAAGGDGYETFLEGDGLAYGDPEVWVVAEYIQAHSPVHPKVEGRIVEQ